MPQQIPPEVLAAVLGLTEQDSQNEQLQRQYMLGSMIGNRAMMPSKDRAGLGGAFGALAKGMQGYMGGQQLDQYSTGMQDAQSQRKADREMYFKWLLEQQQQNP